MVKKYQMSIKGENLFTNIKSIKTYGFSVTEIHGEIIKNIPNSWRKISRVVNIGEYSRTYNDGLEEIKNDLNAAHKTTQIFNKNGCLTESIVFGHNITIDEKSTYKYDENGNLIEKVYDNSNYLAEYRILYKYDDGNDKIESNKYDYRDRLLSTCLFNKKGNCVEKIGYEFEGNISKKIYKYDENDNIVAIKSNRYDKKDNQIKWNIYYLSVGKEYKFKYDKFGNIVEKKEYNFNEYIYSRAVKYNHRREIGVNFFNVQGENNVEKRVDKKFEWPLGEKEFLEFWHKVELNYKNGSKFISKFFENDNLTIEEYKLKKSLLSTYKYDKNGNLIEKITLNDDESINRKFLYKYDDRNYLCLVIGEDSIKTFKYEYDRNGNWIKKIEFQNDVCKYQFERVIDYFSKPVKPVLNEVAYLYFDKGDIKFDLGDFKEAIENYDEAIRLKPSYKAAYNNRGLTKIKIGDFKGCIEDCNKAIEIDPYYSYPYKHRGVSKYNLNELSNALYDLNKAIELNSEYKEAYYFRGIVKNALKNEACEDWSKAIQLGYVDTHNKIKKNCN